MILDYYKILQINPDANIETIKTAYRSRALVCHPDRGGSHEQMVLVNEAFQILSNQKPTQKRQENKQNNIQEIGMNLKHGWTPLSTISFDGLKRKESKSQRKELSRKSLNKYMKRFK
jgi:curved DNA-binding protein CbpA